jgi:hypothetical protein
MAKPGPKAKKKKAKPKLSKKEQSARFIEMARTLGVDETGKNLMLILSKSPKLGADLTLRQSTADTIFERDMRASGNQTHYG